MIKKRALAAGLWAAGTLLVLAAPAQAALIGQTVNASVQSIFTANLNQMSAVVSAAGPEFVLGVGTGRAINIDVQDSFIDFQYNSVRNANLGNGNISVSLSGLTWAPDPGVVVGVTLEEFPDPNRTVLNLLGPNTADFTANSITVNLNGTWNAEDRVRVSLITGHSQVLPEPASLALFGVGLLGLGVAVRRHRRMVNSR